MTEKVLAARRRGRPPKRIDAQLETREALIRTGLAVLTEKGFAATGIDEVLRQVGVPKGSFYHYFDSKEAFGREVIAAYAAYFGRKLDSAFADEALSPLRRLEAFVADAADGMARFDFRRGCLIGNLGQEMASLPEPYRDLLEAVFRDWERRLSACLDAAKAAGELTAGVDCERMARSFWIGWEGAVLRAKLIRSAEPLHLYLQTFIAALVR